GTSSYEEIETTDVIIMWGSNAREAHPIFFHHALAGIRNGAKMYCVDPRRSSTAKFADLWLGLNVGTDIALANGIGKYILDNDLQNDEFIAHSTQGLDDYIESIAEWTLGRTAEVTGLPEYAIAELATAYATADSAQLCWTLGITEHHTGAENVMALCNLSLLTGHVGRYGSGLVPIRGQNNVQGGGDMGALPNKLTGFQDLANDDLRAKFETAWDCTIPATPGKHLTLMFEAMESGELDTVFVIGENPADSEADINHARKLLSDLKMLVVQDIFLTRTAELADVVLPASAGWAESEGTVTNSERRVQRCRKALDPPGEAKDDLEIINLIADRMSPGWGNPGPEEMWDELRTVSPMHGGMSWARLDAEGGLQWPCPTEDHPGSLFLHGWLWADDLEGREPAPFTVNEWRPPVDELSEEFPLLLTTGRVLDSYNTGVQSDGYKSPIRSGEELDLSPSDAEALGVANGTVVEVSSRRATIDMIARVQPDLPKGLAFTTYHFAETTDVNQLTIEAWDEKSGTAEFKATAINVRPKEAVHA
ncbi:MAG: molybdopterin oxidoreductase family protein, partial [Acidimicrobiales bacterium]